MRVSIFAISVLSIFAISCVPKTEYQNQQSKLEQAEAQIKELADQADQCDPDTFLQLQEQAQSLDILQQELIDRNTQLSDEVARLRVYESQVKGADLSCDKRINDLKEQYEGRLDRTKATYEDLIQEQKNKLEEANSKITELELSLKAKKVAPKTVKKPSKAKKTKPSKKSQ